MLAETCDEDAALPAAGMPWAARRVRKSPKRATTNPKAMMVNPVRIHARRVRSAAKKTRGSDMRRAGRQTGFLIVIAPRISPGR